MFIGIDKIICSHCGSELEEFYTKCPHCDAPDAFIGYYDLAGGYHEGGCGNMPDGTECGECSRGDCVQCSVWAEHKRRKERYIQFKCPECGKDLEIWYEKTVESIPAQFDSFPYEKVDLIYHCKHCGSDWDSTWETQWGDTSQSDLKRHYWG